MDERDWLAERSRSTEPGCGRWPIGCSARSTEADDAVQEAWLRLSRSDAPRSRTWAAG